MKLTESNEQLLTRFRKRKVELEGKREAVAEAHNEWVELDRQVNYLTGCLETVEYITTGKMPRAAYHEGMPKHHIPREHQPELKSPPVRHGKDLDLLN